jgi:dolichyl-phosphate-mannose-protein mannosyltransferase
MLIAELAAAIVVYSIYHFLRPLRGHHSGIGAAFAALGTLWLIKTAAIHWLTGYVNDINQYRLWARHLAAVGPAHFYGRGYSFDPPYPPVAIYALWPAGWLERVFGLSWDNFRFPVETPVLLADFIIAITLFAYLRRSGRSPKVAWAGTLLAALNPALLFDSVVWAQSDAIVSALMWLATLAAIDGAYTLAAIVLALAVEAKPHALILIPLLALWIWRKAGFARIWGPIAAFAVTIIVVAVPFAIGRPWDWLPRFYTGSMSSFPETSTNAFNLLAIVAGLRQAETSQILGVTAFTLGIALMAGVMVVSCLQIWRKPFPASLMLAIFLALFGEFLFAPRMHERYLFPAMVFFAPLAVEDFFWLTAFVLLTLSWFFNLAYVFWILKTVLWLDAHDRLAMLSAALNLILFGAILARVGSLKPRVNPNSFAAPSRQWPPERNGPPPTESSRLECIPRRPSGTIDKYLAWRD